MKGGMSRIIQTPTYEPATRNPKILRVTCFWQLWPHFFSVLAELESHRRNDGFSPAESQGLPARGLFHVCLLS